jgi:hypothetical protein
MNHKQFKSQISEYIDKKLSARELVEFDRHAKECPTCLLELQMTVKAVKEIKRTASKELDLPVNFYAKLGLKLDEADAEKIKGKNAIYTPWFRAAALSFALVLTVVMARQIIKSPEYIGNKGFDKSTAMQAEGSSYSAQKPGALEPGKKEAEEKGVTASGMKAPVKITANEGGLVKKRRIETFKKEKSMELDMAKEGASAEAPTAMNFAASAPAAEPVMSMKAIAPKPALADMQKNEDVVMPMEEKNDASGTFVIRDEAAWKTYASGNTLNPDFSKQMVLYVSLGQRPSAGYGVEFAGIKYETNKITVYVKEIQPKQGSLTAQVITKPAGIKIIDRSNLPVEFVFIK